MFHGKSNHKLATQFSGYSSSTIEDIISFLKNLPIDLIFETFAHLSPRDLSHLSQVNKFFSQVIPNTVTVNYNGEKLLSFDIFNQFWEKLFKQIFPHRLASFSKRKNINWFKQFRFYYVKEYKGLSLRFQKALFYTKTRQLNSIKAMKLKINKLQQKDPLNKSLHQWADTEIKKYFYDEIIVPFFTSNPHTAVDNLHWAICCHLDVEFIKELISSDHQITTSGQDKTPSLLYIAAANGHLPLVKFLLQEDNNVNEVLSNPYSASPLHAAMQGNHVEVAKELLKHGAIINIDDSHKQSPLHYAAEAGSLEAIELLFAHIKEPKNNFSHKYKNDFINSPSLAGTTAFHVAIINGHYEVVKLLIENGALINLANTNNAPLLLATEKNDEDLVALLLANNADINVKTAQGLTALHIATQNENYLITNLLLANKADVNATCNLNITPLFFAAETGSLTMVKLLLANNAHVNHQSFNANTALFYAVFAKKYAVAKYLLEKQADPNIINKDNSNPLICAAKNNDIALIDLLLAHGALDHAANDGTTALYAALNFKNHKIMRQLLDKGANPNATDSQGKTLLRQAIVNEDFTAIKMLLEYKADVNLLHKPNTDAESSSLCMAMYKNNLEIVKILVQYGAQINYEQPNGRTAVFLAAKNKNYPILKFLLAKNADMVFLLNNKSTLDKIALECINSRIQVNKIKEKANKLPQQNTMAEQLAQLLFCYRPDFFSLNWRNNKNITAANNCAEVLKSKPHLTLNECANTLDQLKKSLPSLNQFGTLATLLEDMQDLINQAKIKMDPLTEIKAVITNRISTF